MKTVRETVGDTSWFVRDRFGLFIHWGLYALPVRQPNAVVPVVELFLK